MGHLVAVLAMASPALFFSLGVRTLPFGMSALFIDDLRLESRAFVIATSALSIAAMILRWPRPMSFWLGVLAVQAYFLLAAVVLWAMTARMAVRAPGLFGVSVVAGLVVPGLLFPASLRSVAVVLGFEFAFSFYSYARERQALRASADLVSCVMFVLVNPTLVYSGRGTPTDEPLPLMRVLARVVAGAGLLLAHHVLITTVPTTALMQRGMFQRLTIPMGALIWVQLVIWYLAHSGVASIQIALMRGLGWKVPERYRYPFLARSPEDFWRRWNTYLGLWFYAYVFVPVGLKLARSRGVGPGSLSKSLAVMAAFALCGAIHELSAFMDHRMLSGGALAAFIFGGAVVILWASLTRAWRRLKSRHARSRWSTPVEAAARMLSPLVLVCLITVLGSAFLPGLAGKRAAVATRP